MLVASLQLLDSSPVPTGHAALHEVNEQISALVTSLPTSKEPRRSSSRTSGLPGRCEQGMQHCPGPSGDQSSPDSCSPETGHAAWCQVGAYHHRLLPGPQMPHVY